MGQSCFASGVTTGAAPLGACEWNRGPEDRWERGGKRSCWLNLSSSFLGQPPNIFIHAFLEGLRTKAILAPKKKMFGQGKFDFPKGESAGDIRDPKIS